MPHRFVLRESDPRYAIGEHGPVHLMVFRGECRIADLQRAEGFHVAQRERVGKRTSVIALVEPGTPTPDASYRDASAKMLAASGPKLASSAIVVAQQGFAGSVYRSIMTTIYMLSRQPVPSKVFGDSPSAAAWTAELQADPELDPSALADALETLRKA